MGEISTDPPDPARRNTLETSGALMCTDATKYLGDFACERQSNMRPSR